MKVLLLFHFDYRSHCRFYLLMMLLLLQEFKKIRDFKREKCGQQYGDLEPWDEAYYTAMMKSSAYDLDSSVCYAPMFAFEVKN